MAYADADFDTQIAAIVTAIDDEDEVAAYKAFGKAKAIHASLTLTQRASDPGGSVERSQSLADLGKSLDATFQAIREADGGSGGAVVAEIARPT
jgi:hypothetical protein